MFGLVLILLAAFTFSSCGASSPDHRYISSQSKIERLNNGVVALVMPTRGTMREMGLNDYTANTVNTLGEVHRPYCSGFWISRTEVLTAAHCVQRRDTIQTFFGPMTIPSDDSPVGDLKKVSTYSQWTANQRSFVSYKIFEVTLYDRSQDLALLTLTLSQVYPTHFTILEIGADPRAGELVYVIGHPAGQAWSLTDGIVSRPHRVVDGGQVYTQTSSQVYFGNSGGPLINNRGQAIGVSSALIVPHLAFFSHVTSIRNFLDGR